MDAKSEREGSVKMADSNAGRPSSIITPPAGVFYMQQRRSIIFLIVILVTLLPLVLWMAWPFLTSLFLASVLAILLTPINNRLCLQIKRPGLATFLTTFVTVILLACLITLAGFALTGELKNAYEGLNQRSIDEGGWPALFTHTVDRIADTLAGRLPVDRDAIRTEVFTFAKSAAGYLLNKVGAAIGGVASVFITGFLVALFLYFLLRYGEDWLRWLGAVMPLDPPITANLFQVVRRSIVANVNGVLAVAVAQGIALSLGFWLLGLRSFVLWGFFGALASVIPVVGTSVVWVPIVIVFIFAGSYWKAVILAAWCGLVVGSVDNVLRPFVVGAGEKQNPALSGLAMIGGVYAFGPLGILLGPLLISLVFAIMDEIRKVVTNHMQVPATAADITSQPYGDEKGVATK
jgi:predicted PurR-regulated permease PerM